MTLRVLIADDHPLYREGLTTAIGAMPGVDVVGEATNGQEAADLVDTLTPDIVVMDLYMPVVNGIDATRQILAKRPGTAVLILTMVDGDDSIFAAMRAGARGYLLKGADRKEIARSLETVASGELVFGSVVAARVLAFFAAGGTRAAPFPELTDREREVLDLLARGLTNAAIAARLVVSDKTIRNHVSNVFSKLHVTDRAAAVARARDAGLGLSPENRVIPERRQA
jgi:DNA-binding NarL/FixJ family response regulator